MYSELIERNIASRQTTKLFNSGSRQTRTNSLAQYNASVGKQLVKSSSSFTAASSAGRRIRSSSSNVLASNNSVLWR